MSDFPFKAGDLIEVKSSITKTGKLTVPGVVVSVRDDGFLEVLVDDKVRLVHRNYIVTPRIKAVKMTGGIK
mgnify:FL=1